MKKLNLKPLVLTLLCMALILPACQPAAPTAIAPTSAPAASATFVATATFTNTPAPATTTHVPTSTSSSCTFDIRVMLGGQPYYEEKGAKGYTSPNSLYEQIKAENVSVYITTSSCAVYYDDSKTRELIPANTKDKGFTPQFAGGNTRFTVGQ